MPKFNSTPFAILANVSSENGSSTQGESKMVVTLLFLALLAILIIVINCCVIFLVWRKKILRTQANICLASLACSDLLTGLCAIPLVIVCTLLALHTIVWCLAMELVNRLLSISAILHLLVIAVERYVVIVRRVMPQHILSYRKYVVILSAVWCIPLCVSLCQLSFLDWQDKVPETGVVSQAEIIIYDLVCFLGFVCLPLLVILVAYSRIFFVLRRHTKDIEKHTSLFESDVRQQKHKIKEKRGMVIYSLMIVVYILGWFPYFLMTLSVDLGGGIMVAPIPEWLCRVFMFTRFLSPLANPILYTFFKHDFKTVILTMRRGAPQGRNERRPRSLSPHGNTIPMETLRDYSSIVQ